MTPSEDDVMTTAPLDPFTIDTYVVLAGRNPDMAAHAAPHWALDDGVRYVPTEPVAT
jgi:hypothetical protein